MSYQIKYLLGENEGEFYKGDFMISHNYSSIMIGDYECPTFKFLRDYDYSSRYIYTDKLGEIKFELMPVKVDVDIDVVPV
jgi:hypothetical protein